MAKSGATRWPRFRHRNHCGRCGWPDTPELIRLRSDAIELFAQGRMREVLQANLAFAFHPAHAAVLAPAYLAMIDRAGARQLIAQNRAVMARADLGRCCRRSPAQRC